MTASADLSNLGGRWVDRITSLLHSPSQRSREMGFALAVVTWRQASTACRHVGRVWFTASCNTVKVRGKYKLERRP